jgi:hypothetical protein
MGAMFTANTGYLVNVYPFLPKISPQLRLVACSFWGITKNAPEFGFKATAIAIGGKFSH